ncbi:aldo/keto reductase [Psychrobium sp. MM17-31]|uniref:aldo/keto reductase n=1 Tax=Psychrobium sp. MM17-31 TaxID=2917758 RepID=UPI001EF58FD2|nr:aldo/keto reductase [Psychrobium sp. MM17-31]MCG7531181.1 aldo/keto reductase [Psychrobium sp. MM17-31]
MHLQQHFPHMGAIAMGCMGFGGAWDGDNYTSDDVTTLERAITTCLEHGINLFDHADIYKHGRSEQAFGDVLKQSPHLRDDLILQTKCGIRFADEKNVGRYDFSQQWITHSVENSLRRLNTDHIDILLLHRPDPLMEVDEIACTFDELKQSGKVKHFGVSNMHPYQIDYLQRALAMPLVANQLEMSLLNNNWINQGVVAGMTDNPHFSDGIIEHSQLNNIQLQAWGCLAQGKFTGNGDANHAHTSDLVATLAHEYNVSPEAIVIAWLMRHPAKIQPVLGTTNSERIKACAQAKDISLSREHWYQLLVSARGQALP